MTHLSVCDIRIARFAQSLMDSKDPYTSGHQDRVGRLGVEIGKQLGMNALATSAIYYAGLVHDLGKISVPTEILNKPSKLTRQEFELVKTHVESGVGILQQIGYDGKITTIVHQHHERLDGSGYPLGIGGSELLDETYVLAVADVIEAMTSHRPYRPSLGLGKAIAEIQRGSGVIYRKDVVDATLAVLETPYGLDFLESHN